MTREMVESFCNSYYIPDEVHPTASWRDRNITQFLEGKVGVYTRLFDYCGYRIPFTKFFVAILKHFRIHISQLSPFGAARVSHFEVLTRVLDLASSVAVFRAFYTRIYSDELFSFAKRSLSSPSYLSKPPDSIKNWADHFFWVDSKVFPISVPLYMGGVLEKDPAPHLTARQEQAVQVLSSNKAPFRRYPECFLVLVGLSPYYPFDENTYPAFERPDKTDMGLLDYIRTADPRKVQAVEVQKGEEQVKLLDSIKHCFVSLDAPAVVQQEGGSGSGAGPEVSAPSAEENVVAEENIIPVGTYLDLMDPEGDLTVAEKGDAARKQPEKAKRKKLLKQSDTLPAKRLRVDHPSLASGTGGKTLASLRRTIPEGSLLLGPSSQADVHTQFVYGPMGGSSQPETSEESADSFYETAALNSEDAKRWYIPRWNITNDSLVDRICLGSEVRSRTEHELELKEKLRAKYDAQGVLLREKDVEISRLKSLVEEKETESAEKDTDISLIDSRTTYLKSALDDSHAAYTEAKNLISTLTSERDGLASERRWKLSRKRMPSAPVHGIWVSALGRAVDFGMQEGLAAGHEHGVAGTPLSAVTAYNPETVEANYLDAIRALEEADFPLVHLLKFKKDSGMDEVLDCFLLNGPLADLPEATHLQPCLEQLSIPIYHADVKAVVEETSLSFALLNVHTRAEGAKKHATALRQLMVDIVSHPLSSQNLLGEASTSAAALSVEDLDTDEDLGSVVCMPFALLNVHTHAEGAKKHAAALRVCVLNLFYMSWPYVAIAAFIVI
ncbi:hypothetical protein Tco_0356880 [Tanacetum coccineum]